MNLPLFRKNLKFLRRQAGLSQEGMARWLKVKRSTYGAWEEGRAYPNVPLLVLLCNRMGIVDIRALLTRDLQERAESPEVRAVIQMLRQPSKQVAAPV